MLKNITLSILCVFCISFTAKAQFTIDEDTLLAEGYVAKPGDLADVFAHTKIRNGGTTPDTLVWNRTLNQLPSGSWTSAVCDILQCHAVTVNSADFILAPKSTNELSFHFYPGEDRGKGKMIVRFARKSNPNIFIDVYINCQAYGLGINSIINPAFKLFPNPASSSITFNSEKIKDGTFEIYNLLGEKVMDNTFHNAQAIDVSALTKGIYFVTIKDGNSSATSKLVIE